MSYEVTKPDDLLGAYLSNELTQEERAVVERLLQDDASAASCLEELRDLCALLKDAEREILPETVAALRRNVFQKIREKELKTLVTVSVTGDLNEKESADVQAYLNTHPDAQAARHHAASMVEILKGGNRNADKALAEMLRTRLKSVLPAAALTTPQVPVTAKTESFRTTSAHSIQPAQPAQSSQSGRTTTASGRQERPSLRVFVPRENPWKKRLIMASGLAALLAIGLAVRALLRFGDSKVPMIATEGPLPASNDNIEPQNPGRQLVPLNKKEEAPFANTPPVDPHKDIVPEAPKPEVADGVNPPVAPQQIPVEVPAPMVVQQDKPPEKPGVEPRAMTPQADRVATDKPKIPDMAVGTNTDTPANPNNVVTVTNPGLSSPIPESQRNPGGGGGAILPPVQPPGNGVAIAPETTGNNPTTPPPSNPPGTPPGDFKPVDNKDTIQPKPGAGVVGKVKGTDIQILGNTGNATTPKSKDTIPSGSTIVTAGAQISLVLPGNGRLYIQANSSLTLGITGTTTNVALAGGEIYYIAPAGGSLNVTSGAAKAQQVIEGGVSLIGGKLVVLNCSDTPLAMGGVTLANGEECSSPVNGAAWVWKDDPVLLVYSGAWRSPVNLEGDSIKVQKPRKSVSRAR